MSLGIVLGSPACAVTLVSPDSTTVIACQSDADCPGGILCDLTSHLCSVCQPACAEGQECRGGTCVCSATSCAGCCVGDACVSETSPQSCGQGGVPCVQCSGLTPSCVEGECIADCGTVACGTGCCASDGCHPGTTTEACGATGACTSCVGAAAGTRCVSGNCGCLGAVDCAVLSACDGGTCSTVCSASADCNGGCCDSSGTCRTGDSGAACGAVGELCVDCTNAPEGSVCLVDRTCGCAEGFDCAGSGNGFACLGDGACGCTGPADCPAGTDCSSVGGRNQCVPRPCDGVSSLCPGTCCLPTLTCNAVQSASRCGTDGASCVSCAGNPDGPECLDGVCGCDDPSDCAEGEACHQGVCGTTCAAASPCNGGCCSLSGPTGTCEPGYDNDACGSFAVCEVCGAGTTCDDAVRVCQAEGCGDASITVPGGDLDPCVGGCCGGVQPRSCVSGTTNLQCGNDGLACDDCDGNETCNASGVCSASGCDATHSCVDGLVVGSCCNGSNTCVSASAGCECNTNSDCAFDADGTTCILNSFPNRCGCTSSTDCSSASQPVCDVGSASCVACDDSHPCSVGCCDDGQCVVSCLSDTEGTVCIQTSNPDHCGCNTSADCPDVMACDSGSKRCVSNCSDTTTCKSPAVCDGGTCIASCAASANGKILITSTNPDHCGCNSASDCDIFKACGTTFANYCTDNCDVSHPCRGGCCGPGGCESGNTNTACGLPGTECVNCAIDPSGHDCQPSGLCGCDANNDCTGLGGVCSCTTTNCNGVCD